jgi:hypothetical protein
MLMHVPCLICVHPALLKRANFTQPLPVWPLA